MELEIDFKRKHVLLVVLAAVFVVLMGYVFSAFGLGTMIGIVSAAGPFDFFSDFINVPDAINELSDFSPDGSLLKLANIGCGEGNSYSCSSGGGFLKASLVGCSTAWGASCDSNNDGWFDIHRDLNTGPGFSGVGYVGGDNVDCNKGYQVMGCSCQCAGDENTRIVSCSTHGVDSGNLEGCTVQCRNPYGRLIVASVDAICYN